jgi:hypothetical protein
MLPGVERLRFSLVAAIARRGFPRPSVLFPVAGLLILLGATLLQPRAQVVGEPLPKQLSDRAFWQMIVDFSEEGGVFPSDNFVSNELTYQEIIPELKKRSSPDGVYVGVGPDQNFTYITALQPRLAFIIDVRRQNLVQHLLYKAIVEMSADRAEFLAHLFSRPRPPGVDRAATPEALFDLYREVDPDEALFRSNLQEIEYRLIERHGFALTLADRGSLQYIYRAFFSEGPDLRYSFPRQRAGRWFPTYAELMTATDAAGAHHSYLATEEDFRILRDFETRNLLVPIVGDFGGDKAIRAVGKYLGARGATVNYFYTSNVEQYLFQTDAWRHYYSSVATLPLNENSTFIRAYFNTGYIYPPGIVSPDLHSVQLLDPIVGCLNAFGGGDMRSYIDLVRRSR